MLSTRSPERDQRSYHPQFNSPEADIILVSSDDTAYRVPHFTLRNTCGFFRSHLAGYTPPYGPGDSTDRLAPIEVVEKDKILSKVLCMLCGLHTGTWDSIDDVDDAATLAQRWDAPGPLCIIRSGITAPMFLADPLRLYAIATRLGWDDEARMASTQTLSLDLYDEEYRPALERISSRHLMTLMRLHRSRRDGFKRLIDGDSYFGAGNAAGYLCPGCGEETTNHTWRELKVRMYIEMDRRPLGDTLCGLEMEEWPEAIACWNAKCRNCGRLNYNKINTLRDIQDCIDKIPLHV